MKRSLHPLAVVFSILLIGVSGDLLANPKSAALAQQRNKAAHQQVNANNAKKAQALLLQRRKQAPQAQELTMDQKVREESETSRDRELP
jgi:hypothetical protein